MPCTELVVFPASGALLANSSTGDKPLGMIGAAPGALDIYSGLAVEDNKTTYLAIGWETIEHHQALVRSSEYDGLKASFKDLLGGPLTVQHTHFNASTSAAFNAPITEFTTFKSKEGKPKDELMVALAELEAEANKHNKKYAPCALGESVENSGTFFLVIGWDSTEDHSQMVKNEATITIISLLDTIKKLAEVSVHRVGLTKFRKA